MRNSRTSASQDVGLIAACLAVTAIAWWIVAMQHGAPWWLHALVIAVYGAMAFIVLRRDARSGAVQTPPMSRATDWQENAAATEQVDGVAERVARSFLGWLAETPPGESWNAFDQFVRELLANRLGAGHVRCFRVAGEPRAIVALSGSTESGALSPGCNAMVERVLATGKDYLVAPGASQAPGAAGCDVAAAWLIPGEEGPVGLITIGSLPRDTLAQPSLCRTVELLVRDFWLHVAARDALAIAQQTDKPTGVLSREGFFAAGRSLLADSRRTQEPVVAVVVAIEGMRRLDDDGQWGRRDDLVGRVGAALAARLRTDDCIGRFADDRFAILLRRADAGLGKLISEKLVSAVSDELAGAPELAHASIRGRAGLMSNAMRPIALEKLLSGAFEAMDQARRSGVRVMADSQDCDGVTI